MLLHGTNVFGRLPMTLSDPFTLLVIDEDLHNLETIQEALSDPGFRVITANTPEEGFETFVRVRPRIVLVGLKSGSRTGMELLDRMLGIDPGVDVILVSDHYSAESAVEAIHKGACDYMTRPLDVDQVRTRVVGLLADAEQRRKTSRLDHELLEAYRFEGIVGRSPLMLEVFAKVRRIAPHFRTVLVRGATGTGRNSSPRRFTASAPPREVALSYAIARRWLTALWKASCSGTFAVPSLEQSRTRLDYSNMRMVEPFFSMKSVSYLPRRRRSYCESCKIGRSRK